MDLVNSFWRLTLAFREVEGFLDPVEGYLLFRLAAEGPGLGASVEIGSYCGRSTAYLAAGSKLAQREHIVAVDHFQGSPEHQAGQEFASLFLTQEGSTYPRFRANLERLGLSDSVEPHRATSQVTAQSWSGPIRLLFIDGDHSYEAARADFTVWSSFIVPGGLVAFHDVGNAPGVSRLVQELTAGEAVFQEVLGAVSRRVLRKR